MIAEDEENVRRGVRRTLERLGYRVFDARDGDAALALAAAYDGPIDVLVTDLMMPGMNGRQLADALVLARRNLRVIYMSGYTDETVDREGLVRAGRTFLQKPFTGTQVASAIRAILAPKTPTGFSGTGG